MVGLHIGDVNDSAMKGHKEQQIRANSSKDLTMQVKTDFRYHELALASCASNNARASLLLTFCAVFDGKYQALGSRQ